MADEAKQKTAEELEELKAQEIADRLRAQGDAAAARVASKFEALSKLDIGTHNYQTALHELENEQVYEERVQRQVHQFYFHSPAMRRIEQRQKETAWAARLDNAVQQQIALAPSQQSVQAEEPQA